jgi:hypothetical protein
MDVAKYIGLFLLKYNYCCLQGLGNLELRRIPARQQGDTLEAPRYEAVLSQTGSIDDALANFIATAEFVSIAKASNEIREFITYVKAELAAGHDVPVPSIGKYTPGPGAQIRFELDPAFSMPAKTIHVAPVRPPVQAPPPAAPEPYRQSSVNWSLVALWSVILLIAGTVVFLGARYLINRPAANTEVAAVDSQIVDVTPVQDTTLNTTVPADSLAVVVTDTMEYNFVISTYKGLAAAQRRAKQLNSYGHDVSIMTTDSAAFYVVKKMRMMPADTLHMRDSLTKVLNPAGVTILQ